MSVKKKRRWVKITLITIGVIMSIVFLLGIIFRHIVYMLIFQLGYSDVYNGNNERGNEIMEFAISKMENPDAQVFHALSVQNSKNGNYDISIKALEKAYELDSYEGGAYYGWVLLYYYHDYEKSLHILNLQDESTPNFNDWPMGECIHYLKGLAQMQLEDYDSAIKEFDISIANTVVDLGEEWVDYQVFLNKGIVMFRQKKYKDAIKQFRKVIKYNDTSSEAYYYLGQVQIELNLQNQACENFNQAYELIKKGHKSSDVYVELFHEIYLQEVEQYLLKYCNN